MLEKEIGNVRVRRGTRKTNHQFSGQSFDVLLRFVENYQVTQFTSTESNFTGNDVTDDVIMTQLVFVIHFPPKDQPNQFS